MFVEIGNRDAWSTIRGFVYQVDTTILRWINLGDNEILELEKGEDIDIVSRDIEHNEISRELEQIKYRESSITLNQEVIIEMLYNFFLHKSKNPSNKILFRFVTNANYGIERPALFVDGKSGIEVWGELSRSLNISKDDNRLITLKSHLLKKINEKIGDTSKSITEEEIKRQESWNNFSSYITNDETLIQFIKDFEWSLGSDNQSNISESIKEILVHLSIVTDAKNADIIYSRLFLHVFKILCTRSLKKLERDDLIKQIALQELSTTDQNLLKLLTKLLVNIDSRVTELEEKVKINSSQISTLISDVNLIRSPNTEFDFILRSISVKPPSLVKNGSFRDKKVSEIIKKFKTYSWISFQGINGTGKSQLAALICSKIENYWWLDLRAYNDNVEKTALLIESFLSIISKCPLSNDRNIWVNKAIKSIPQNSIIVFNDLPRIESNSVLGELLIFLSNELKETNIKLLTTSNFTIPNELKQFLHESNFLEYSKFEFTDEEIIEYLVKNGAEESITKYIPLIIAVTQRNPRLISAIILHLRSLNWGRESVEIFDVLFNKEFSIEILRDAQSSIRTFVKDDKSRELLYRLSLISWNFKFEEVKAISEVELKIPHPYEKLQDLINLWIQVQEDTFQVSPLINNIGNYNLSQEVIENVHIAIGESILLTKKLDQISASRGITSFIKGKDYNNAGLILLNLYRYAKSKKNISILNSWGYLNYWTHLDIPKEMSVILRTYIRIEQIRLFHSIGKDTSTFYNRLNEYLSEDSLTISERLLIHFSCLTNLEVIDLQEYWIHLDYVLKNWNSIDTSFKDVITIDMFSGLLWFPIQQLIKEKDIILWFKYVDYLESEFKLDFFNNEISQNAVTIICSKIVNLKIQGEDNEWKLIISNLNLIINYFNNRNLEILAVVALKEIIALEFQKLKNQSKALKLTNTSANRTTLPIAKYLLFENIGKLYYNASDVERAKKWLFKAIEIDCPSQTNYIDTLIYGACAISKEDSKKAVELCERAIALAKNKEEYLELNYIQLLGELGIAYWIDGKFKKSFETFEDVVNRLFKLKVNKGDQSWIRTFLWCGHSLGYISASVGKDRVPEFISDGTEYVKPYQGIFSFNTKDLSDIYKDKNDPIILTHLAIFSDAINNISKAYHWSLRAFDLARKNGDQKIFLMISGVCSQYSLINFKAEEAFESYLLFSAVTTYLIGSPKEKHDKLNDIKLSELYSMKPSENWDAIEDSTVLFAIIPLYIMLLTAHLEDNESKNAYTQIFMKMLQDYTLKASDKTLWEVILELTTRIIEDEISENELINRGNTFGEQGRKNLQIICILGVIVVTKDYKVKMIQIINIFSFLTKVYKITRSIIKFVLFPFVKIYCLNIYKETFVGTKKEYEEIVNQIESIDITDRNALQNIIQPIVRELDIELIDDRKSWLFEFKEI